MSPGEYAVHYSSFEASATPSGPTPYCTVLPSLAAAEAYAREQVAERPSLRCRIYSHEGLVSAPVREIAGPKFKGELDLSPRLRRWLGAGFLIGGLLLVLLDWSADFRLSWPALVGSRLLIPGLVLLATEGLILLNKWQKLRRGEAGSVA